MLLLLVSSTGCTLGISRPCHRGLVGRGWHSPAYVERACQWGVRGPFVLRDHHLAVHRRHVRSCPFGIFMLMIAFTLSAQVIKVTVKMLDSYGDYKVPLEQQKGDLAVIAKHPRLVQELRVRLDLRAAHILCNWTPLFCRTRHARTRTHTHTHTHTPPPPPPLHTCCISQHLRHCMSSRQPQILRRSYQTQSSTSMLVRSHSCAVPPPKSPHIRTGAHLRAR
jgi:hypothetical protein